MTDWREELVEKMAREISRYNYDTPWQFFIPEARAALAVAEPAIREQCAEMAENYGYDVSASKYASSVGAMCACGAAKDIAAAIREGGKNDAD